MEVIKVYLKHFYQRLSILPLGIFSISAWLIFFLYMGHFKIEKPGDHSVFFFFFFFYFYWLLYLGRFLGQLEGEITSKPFSFCLPDYRRALRKFFFLGGVVLGLVFSIPFLRYKGLNIFEMSFVLIVLYSYGIAAFVTGCIGHFFVKKTIKVVILLLMRIITFFVVFIWGLGIILENPYSHLSFLVLLFSIFVCIQDWRIFEKETFDRTHAEIIMKLQSRSTGRDRFTTLSYGIESFFISRLRKYKPGALEQYIWGGIYRTFAIALSQWKLGVFCIPASIILFGYFNQAFVSGLIFFIALSMFIVQLPVYSNMLTAGGRKERFYYAIAVSAATVLTFSLIVAIVCILSGVLAKFAPAITIKSDTISYEVVSFYNVYIILFVVPLAFIVQLFFEINPVLTTTAVIVVTPVAFILLFWPGMDLYEELVSLHPISRIVWPVCMWMIFLMILWCICMRRALSGPYNIHRWRVQ